MSNNQKLPVKYVPDFKSDSNRDNCDQIYDTYELACTASLSFQKCPTVQTIYTFLYGYQ